MAIINNDIENRLAFAELQRGSKARRESIVLHMIKLQERVAELVKKQMWYDDLLRQLGPWWNADMRKWMKAMNKLDMVRTALIKAQMECVAYGPTLRSA